MTAEAICQTSRVKYLSKEIARHVAAATGLFRLEALVLHGILIGIIIFLAALFWLIPAALASVAFWFAEGPRRSFEGKQAVRLRVLKALVWVTALGAIVLAEATINRIAERNAAPVIAALNGFKQEHNNFPRSLNRLVPQYLSSIPRATPTLTHNLFVYEFVSNEQARLYYWYRWPVTMRYFDFYRQIWEGYAVMD